MNYQNQPLKMNEEKVNFHESATQFYNVKFSLKKKEIVGLMIGAQEELFLDSRSISSDFCFQKEKSQNFLLKILCIHH